MSADVGASTALAGTTGVITGASGFIGRAVLRHLPAESVVHAAYCSSSDFPEWSERCAADIRPLRIDLSQERLADQTGAVDWALLLASRVATADSWADPMGELEAVAGVTLRSVIGLQADRVVLMSSGSVYETLEGALGPHRVLAPRLPYSIAKLTAELLFAAHVQAPYWIIRFFGAFGPGEPQFKLARRLTEAFKRGERRFALAGDGTNRIDPIYVEEAAARICALLATKPEGRIVDLSQGEHLTVRAFAQAAYDAVHPTAGDRPLDLAFTGHAHELMLGGARSDPAIWHPGLEHISVSEGFRRYAAYLDEE